MATRRTISITVGRFGQGIKKIKVPAGSTVRVALKEAGFDLSSAEKIWLGGERASARTKLKNGSILNVVGSRAGGV